MKIQIFFQNNERLYGIRMTEPIRLALPLVAGADTPNCFYAPAFDAEPVRFGDFVGSTAEGGAVNFFNIRLNPHGNGTHTECVGHISRGGECISDTLRETMFLGLLISIYPRVHPDGDRVIEREQIEEQWALLDDVTPPEALLLRTLPNDDLKCRMNYSGANPAYLAADAAAFMAERGVKHLLLDLPSVDREEDGGALAAHKAFWQYPDSPRTDSTITELIYVPSGVKDGFYLLDLQVPAFRLDAAPSMPIIYKLY